MSLSAASKANFLTQIFLPAITCHFETRPLLPLLTFISCSRQPDHTALICLFSDIDLHEIICDQTKSNIKNTSISTIKSTNIVLQRNSLYCQFSVMTQSSSALVREQFLKARILKDTY